MERILHKPDTFIHLNQNKNSCQWTYSLRGLSVHSVSFQYIKVVTLVIM